MVNPAQVALNLQLHVKGLEGCQQQDKIR